MKVLVHSLNYAPEKVGVGPCARGLAKLAVRVLALSPRILRSFQEKAAGFSCYTYTVLEIEEGTVTNLTVKMDEETLKRARIRALEQGTSVNALLRAYLEDYTGIRKQRKEAGEDFLRLTDEHEAGSGPGGRSWTRDEIYERG